MSSFLTEDGAMRHFGRRWGRTASLCVLAAMSVSCRRKHDEQTVVGATATPSAVSNTSTAGMPQVVGGTAAALHAYLTTVDTVRGATFDVSWRPGTVRLDRETATRTLQGVSPDGATFRFANDPALGAIKPGAVMLVWGVALRRVDSVASNGGSLLVHTSVASLTDAIDHGHIAWKGPADFAHGVVAPTYLKPDSLKVSMAPADQFGFRVRPVSYVRPAGEVSPLLGSDNENQGNGPDQNGQSSGGDSSDSTAIPTATSNIKSGDAAGFEYEVAYLYTGGGLDFEMELTKKPGEADTSAKEAGKENNKQIVEGLKNQQAGTPEVPPPAQGNPDPNPLATAIRASMKANKEWSDAKESWDRKTQDIPSAVWASLPALTSGKLWGTAYSQLDLRVKAQGHIDGLDLGGDISIANAKQIASKFSINNLSGLVNLQYIARLGQQQPTWDGQLKAMLPVTFNIPIIIGGIPFMFQVGVNLYAVPGLSGHFATAQGTAHLNFSGSAGLQVGSGNVSASGQYQGNGFVFDSLENLSSVGVSAILVSVEFPRLGFGVGLFNSYSIAFIDFVGTASIVNSGAMALMPCTRMQLNAAMGAGISTQVVGLPSFINNKLSKRLPNLWDWQQVTYKPKNLNCEYKKGTS